MKGLAVLLGGALVLFSGELTKNEARAQSAEVGDPSGVDTQGTLYKPNAGLSGFSPYQSPEAPTNQELSTNVSHAFFSLNMVWVLLCGFLVMFMQAGFALVETGLVRLKNVAHTMLMNLMVYAIGMLGFFLSGFALMSGGMNGTPIGGPGNLGGLPHLDSMFKVSLFGKEWGLFGMEGFLLSGSSYDAATLVWFLFMMVFMDTTATIPTGALAERWKLKNFAIFSFFIGAFTYPVFACWVWGGGWLAQLGMNFGIGHGLVDYAGSSVVHLQGGVLALLLAKMLGPRIGKYDSNGRPRFMPGHDVSMVVLGTLVLAFGWFGFNTGSSLSGADGRIGVVAVNTMLASAAGCMAAALYLWFRTGKPEVCATCNGMLGGLVAITAPCAFVSPLFAVLIGSIGGLLSVVSAVFIEERGVDDPVGAVSVHGVNGVWGMLAVGLFADGTYGAGLNGVSGGVTGLLFGDGRQLVAQGIGIGSCILWNLSVGYVLFKVTGLLTAGNRVSEEMEIEGLDVSEVLEPAPAE
jgi:ammonium transporter, Amt family